MQLETEVYLGSDTDCETCGWSYNQLRYAYDPAERMHHLSATIGCYGGASKSTRNNIEAVAFLAEEFAGFTEALDQLDALTNTILSLP